MLWRGFVKIDQLIEGYLVEYGDKYKTNISHFHRYLKEIGKTDKLNAITIEDVKNYVGYGKAKGIIHTSKTMEYHLESIKDFYKYLTEKGIFNSIFSSVVYNHFKQDLQKFYDLKEVVPRGIFSDAEIDKILNAFKRYFVETNYEELVGKQARKSYKRYMMASLFVKLTLLIPVKRKVISSIKISDFSVDFYSVYINGYFVELPKSIKADVKNMLAFVKKYEQREYKENEMLFDYVMGREFKGENFNVYFASFCNEQLKGIKDSVEQTENLNKYTVVTENLRNYAMVSFLKNNDVDLIQYAKLCGVSPNTVVEKLQLVNESEQIDSNSKLNRDLQQVAYYEEL